MTQSADPSTATVAPYGAWESPISAEDLAGAVLGFSDLAVQAGALYWRETRPAEGGRAVIVRCDSDGGIETVTPEGFNVRSRVHEYGGLAYTVASGAIYFVNFADQHLYRQTAGGMPEALTPDGLRYADCIHDPARRRLIGIAEDHRGEGEERNAIAAIPLTPSDGGTVLFGNSDFVGYPRLSPDGSKLAWIAWDHPNMPWDNVALWVADLAADGSLATMRRINEGVDESVIQPQWAPDGTLYFISDRTEWWNLYSWDGTSVRAVHARAAEFGGPLWQVGQRYYDILDDGRLVVQFGEDGRKHLGVIDPATGALDIVALPGGAEPVGLVADGSAVVLIASYRDGVGAILRHDLKTNKTDIIRRAGEDTLDLAMISIGEALSYPTTGGDTAHAYYYPPRNAHFKAPDGEKPPLIVTVHGGPTAMSGPGFNLGVQYWTTRGFAVLDVNYRGSTGFGRSYRQKLYDAWGIADVEDAIEGALYLAGQGLADRDRLIIRGGSAGGYVVLAAMAFHDVFATGANYFGVSDVEALALHTHKFESRYVDQLIGPYPERKDIYIERSPIHHLDGFHTPLIVLQGQEDKVVPPGQSEAIVNALRKKGVPVAYLAFEGEQHGFRKPENNKRAQEAELFFYGRILGFTPAGALEPVEIENL